VLKFFIASAFICATAFPVVADDIWSGEYWGDCGNKVQCWMEITNGGATNIDVAFVVADRLDDRAVKCKLAGKFTRSYILLIEGNVAKAGKVSVGASKQGMEVFGIPRKACGVTIGGMFQPIGD
jgi:hypothetical protein